MWKRRRLILVSLVVILLGGFAWLIFHSSEPVYQGKPLTFWLKQFKENDGIDAEAETAIRAMGSLAIPKLLSLLETKDTAFRRWLTEFAKDNAWFPIHPRPAEEAQELGACGFVALGPLAKNATPDLIRSLRSSDQGIRFYAAFCLACIGPSAKDAVPALRNRLTVAVATTGASMGRLNEVDCTAYALGEMGLAATSAIPELVKVSTNTALDNFGLARMQAQAALIKLRGDSLEPLVQQLKDTSDPVAWRQAAYVAFFLRTNAEPLLFVLIDSLSNTNPLIHDTARDALKYVHARPDLCIPAIVPSLQSTNAWRRGWTIDFIRAFGPTTNHLGVPEIIKCLSDPDFEVHKKAVRALKQIDPAAAAKMGVK